MAPKQPKEIPPLKQVLTEKECTKCEQVLPIENFGIRVYKGYSQYRSDCKECNQNYSKTYRKENPEKVLEYNRNYLSTRKDVAREWNRRYIALNRERIRECHRIKCAEYQKDPQYRISNNCRKRVSEVMKAKKSRKVAKTYDLIGCSPKFLCEWLEHQFDSTMNWGNYGSFWDIEHVIPCNSFDMTIQEEQYKCFNWTNLRPYSASRNSSKRDKIILMDILMQELKVYHYCYTDEVLDTTL
jgi:hypothetical protein